MKTLDLSKTVPVNEFGNAESIAIRLHKAFPGVAKLFPLVTAGVDDGQAWRDVVDDFTDRLGDAKLEALYLEVRDLFSMGWSDEQSFDTVMCAIFGLADEPVRVEAGSVWKFVATLEERLSGERLQRFSK